MQEILADVRVAARALRRAMGSTSLVLATIAVGVGGVAAVFSVVSALILRPLPFERAAEIVTVDATSSKGYRISTSIPNYRDWRDAARVFSAWGGAAGWSFRLTGSGDSEVLTGVAVLGDLFRVLEVRPHLGRLFEGAETEPGAAPVVVLGHGLWQRRFGADPSLVGRTITLDDRSYTVLGVLPAGFEFPDANAQLYVNMGSIPDLPWEIRSASFGTEIFARLRPGTSMGAAADDIARVGREVREREGADVALPSLRSLESYLIGESARQLWLLLAAVALVLAVAFSNVGGLALARAADRRGDAAVRLAIGGGKRDLVRQFVAENLLLTLTGGTLGLAVAVLLVRVLVRMLPDDLPGSLIARIAIDGWTAVVTLAICAVVGVVLGIVSSRAAMPPTLLGAMRSGGRSVVHSRRGARGVLIVVETALSLVLAVQASLLLASFLHLRQSDKGFDERGVLTARVSATEDVIGARERWVGFYDGLLERTRALPGVRGTALMLLVPLSGRSSEQRVAPEGTTMERKDWPSMLYNVVSPDYFATLGVPLLQGRPFDRTDVNGAPPVVIIDETMAEQFWPRENPIGKRVTIGEMGADSALIYRTVVGVSKNVRHYALATPSRIQVYIPFTQTLERWGMSLSIAIKSDRDPSALVGPLKDVAASLEARVPVWRTVRLDEYLDQSIAGERALGVITSWLAAVAALVTAVGLFGIVSYAVVQRRREIALRMALGADQKSVVALMTWNGVSLAVAGVVMGLVLSAGLSRWVSAFLYGVKSVDVTIYALAAVSLIAVSTAAALVPALRTRRMTPASVLRDE
jgi:predicted permease